MTAIISIENLHKKYILKHNVNKRYGSLRDELTNTAKQLANKFKSPINSSHQQAQEEEFWALNGVNLEIQQGERLGIIGRNGAGKSTLLKVISRIIEPTKGRVTLRGRVSSLLEVGTGFHPELSGRENVYLNGAILGMSKAEISQKFDEIVEFAEVEKFLDTPVKHYSSGMYVRLAFAVASSLEPEILIIDEVLAVGDAQFQKKCLGKLDDVGKSGRTVIFVSHSMPMITSLCDKAVLLDSGRIVKSGLVSDVVMEYYSSGQSSPASNDFSTSFVGDTAVRLLKGEVKNSKAEVALEVQIQEAITIEMTFEVTTNQQLKLVPNFYFYTANGECAFVSVSDSQLNFSKDKYMAICHIPSNILNEGVYFVGLALSSFDSGVNVHFFEKNSLSFNVVDSIETSSTRSGWAGAMPGVLRPKLNWETHKV
ncbi:ABC transporter ATP-binding protein [Methylotenera sp.]|uniref:ABC transporter ATP-binding protein n=1 Tax=Methylotenera sp. TaxID=2051956 RepID=UPI0024894442|nr:ABC transporter ATP-binding protein [Methylotenera sp.]MDI1299688.1 ABC transporter ATP-binding protein [Methylotenera sp.]